MQYLLLIYNDDKLLQALPDGEAEPPRALSRARP